MFRLTLHKSLILRCRLADTSPQALAESWASTPFPRALFKALSTSLYGLKFKSCSYTQVKGVHINIGP